MGWVCVSVYGEKLGEKEQRGARCGLLQNRQARGVRAETYPPGCAATVLPPPRCRRLRTLPLAGLPKSCPPRSAVPRHTPTRNCTSWATQLR